MTFDEYWQSLVAKNPQLCDDENKMRITIAAFRKSIRQAYDMGHDAGRASARAPDEPRRKLDPNSIFGSVFGI